MNRKLTYEELEQRVKELEKEACNRKQTKDSSGRTSQRKQVNKALWESEDLYHTLIETSPDSIVMYSLSGEILAANTQLARVYGVSSVAEFLAEVKTVFDLLTEDGKAFAAANFRRTLAEGHSQKNEYLVRIRGGRMISVEINSSVVRTKAGKPRGFISVVRDITDRKQAEAALRLSEAKFRALAESSSSAIFLIQGTKYIYINPAFETIIGYTMDDLAVMNFWDFVHPDFLELVKNRGIDRLKGQSPPSRYEIKFITKSGHVRWVDYSATVIELENRPTILGSTFDITERKQAEEALSLSEAKFRALAESSSSGIFLIQGTQYTYINPAFEKIIGYTMDDLADMNFWDFIHPNMRELVRDRGLRRLKGDDPQSNYEIKLISKGGEEKWIDYSASIIELENEPTIIGSTFDITERKGAVKELRAKHEELNAADEQRRAQYQNLLESEQALRESEKKYRSVIENIQDVFYRSDLNGRLLMGSPSGAKMFGYDTIDEMIGMPLDSFWSNPKVRGKLLEQIKTMGSAKDFEAVLKKKNGTTFNASLTTHFYYDESGNYLGTEGIIRDITERKQAEEALRESEGKFRDLAEKSLVGIYLVQDDLFKYANSKIADIFGSSVDDIIDKLGPRDMIFPEDLPMVTESVRKRISGELKSMHYEFRICTKSREIKHVEVYSSRTMYQGKPAVIGALLDITNRKKAEEELRRLSIAVEQAAEEITITDPDGVIQYVNPAFEKITGYPRTEAIGQNPRLVKSGIHDAAFYENLWNTIKSGNVWTGRITNKRKDGALIQEDATISPLLSSSGQLTGYVSLKRDVSEIISLETQLRQAQKMEAIGTLAGGIAHDFNNILSAILGYTDMALTEHKEDNRLRHYLDQIFKAGERARDLVKQILTFSRQTDGELRPLRVSPIIKEVLKLLRASLPSTMQIHQDIQSELDTVLAEPTQIHQILMNLCTNAAHAMRERKGELKIILATEEINHRDTLVTYHSLSPGMFLKLTVSDTGVGIAPDIMNRIFDPFFTTKKPGEGTGMGLSVVYGIVKGYGGAITVESELEKGSNFHVYLPLLMGTKSERERDAAMYIIGGKERILFVDDEEDLVQLGNDMLTGLGYEVVGRTSSVEALEVFRIRPHDFDLVITDMTMPNMTGVDLAKELILIRPGIPIILCTGFSEMISEAKAKRIGIRQFIMKPLLMNSLATTIRKVLDEK